MKKSVLKFVDLFQQNFIAKVASTIVYQREDYQTLHCINKIPINQCKYVASNMLIQLANTLVITSIISLSEVYSYSACDDIDIHLIIDTDSIIENYVNIEKFIESVIWNGTSEYTAISIAIYGDYIPSDINSSIIINLNETHSIYQRDEHITKILNQLQTAFTSITFLKSNQSQQQEITTSSLLDAFQDSNNQEKPSRLSKKDLKFNQNNKKKLKKRDEYFVFDYYNRLVSYDIDYNDNICFIIYHNRIINKNIHFIMGQKLTKKSIQNIKCKNNNLFYDRINSRTFFTLPDIYNITNNKLDIILDITCPSYINIEKTNNYNSGYLSLGNNVQWIDINDINKCNLIIIEKNDIKTPIQIDSKLSFIEINSFNNNDNTYKINDYLLIHKSESNQLSNLGCWSKVYKIIDIKRDNIESSRKKLFVSLPSSPTEYITRAKISGKHPLFIKKKKKIEHDSRRLQSLNDERAADFVEILSQNEGPWIKQGSYEYDSDTQQLITSSENFDVTILDGTASIKSNLEYTFDTNMSLRFQFDWDIYGFTIYLNYSLDLNYILNATVSMDFDGNVDIVIDDLFQIEKPFEIQAGYVPVVGITFIDIDLQMKTLPIAANVGYSCIYGGYYKYGYIYNYTNNYQAKYNIITNIQLSNDKEITSWSSIYDIQYCADLNYAYDNLGVACIYFDYNPTTKLCRCISIETGTELMEDTSGTVLYVLDTSCDPDHTYVPIY